MPRRRPKRVTKTMQSVITEEGDLSFLLIRSSARRTLSICIDEKARVSVSVPFYAPLKEAHAFIHEKSKWIHKSIVAALENKDYLSRKNFDHGQRFLFLGKEYNLDVQEKDLKRSYVKFDGFKWSVHVPHGLSTEQKREQIKKKLVQWYRFQAKEILGGRIFHYSRVMGVTPQKIAIRSQKRLWGCCDYTTKTIHLNWQIILSPVRVIDYVVVHELCHLLVPNHSKRFWNKVAKVMPDFNEYKQWLKKNSLDMVLP